MTKIVCDFEEVYSTCDKIDETANTLESELINTRNKVSDTKQWQGAANDAFENSYSEMNKKIAADIVEMRNLSNFVRTATQCIEQTDEILSTYSI